MNGLSTVMGFSSSGAGGCAGLSATQVFGAREFVTGVVDDFVGLDAGRGVGAKAGDLAGKDHQHEDQKGLQQKGSDKTAIREDPEGSFPGEARAGTGQRGTDVGGELLPARGPLDQEPGSVMERGEFFELESFDHREINLEMQRLKAQWQQSVF